MSKGKAKRTLSEKVFIATFLPGIAIMYLVYKYPLIFTDNPYNLYLFGKSPGFWYGLIYTFIVCFIAGKLLLQKKNPYKAGPKKNALSPYQKKKFVTIFLVQLICFFLLPYIVPGVTSNNGFGDDRILRMEQIMNVPFTEGEEVYFDRLDYRLAYSEQPTHTVIARDTNFIHIQSTKGILGKKKFSLAVKHFDFEKGDSLFQHAYLYSKTPVNTGDKAIGVVHSINSEDSEMTILMTPSVNKNAYVYVYNGFTSMGGFIYIFLLVPLSVWFFGKRYCSWFCACGNLAETVGSTTWGMKWVRDGTPRGENSRKMEFIQYMFLIWGIIFGLILFLDAWKLFTVGNLPAMMRSYQDVVVDLMFGALIGVGAYPFFGTRVWCRYGCPLAAGMRLYGKYVNSRSVIIANDKCVGIGECSNVCPMGINVEDYAHKNGHALNGEFGLNSTTCISCGGCIDACPTKALAFSKLVKRDEET